ncbi:acetamidase/formamidase family protein [Oceanobacillus neutriphilus]|uniref:Acetamidase n=1 Tax=Oceanobacillus neutriphilus TaxID=531815 RepID=A0ABQ2P2I1_9BACI|nr:acetamidase/formamidase family protein [Oceanobacillus neutriphilus]GGP16527.1 acetamidase [Oceanobacillus neutriphilus]
MKTYYLMPDKNSLHNHFSLDLDPILTIHSGDSVVFKTLDSAWGMEKRSVPGAQRKRWTETIPERQAPFFGHALIGPVSIHNAEIGDTLEIKINEIIPGEWGWASGGGFPSEWNKKLGIAEEKEVMLDFLIDSELKEAVSQFGNFPYKIKIAPFMGIMGMPPNAEGKHSTFVPRESGGNIDCKELQAGSRLFLPVSVEGGLFSTGDGHAIQGDGEICGPALECPMEKVHLTFILHKKQKFSFPRAETQKAWITMSFHEDLDEAMWSALNNMIDWMIEIYSFSRAEASAWASLAVDLRITQIVNGNKGVHALLAKDKIYK